MLDILMWPIEMITVGIVMDQVIDKLGRLWDRYMDFCEQRRDHWLPEYPDATPPEPAEKIWFHTVPKRRTINGTFAQRAAEKTSLAWAWVEVKSKPLFDLADIPMTKEWAIVESARKRISSGRDRNMPKLQW